MTRKGFTLSELLAVTAILCILAAILFPVLAKVRGRSDQDVDVSNEKQLGIAISQYVQDNNETYPMASQYSPSAFGASDYGWPETIMPYVKSFNIFGSPDDLQALQPLPFPGGYGISYAINGIAVNLAGGTPHLRGVSGFTNSWFGGGNCAPSNPNGCGTDIPAQLASNIPKPSQTVLLTNCFCQNADNSLGSGCNSSTFALSSDFMGGGNGNPAPDNMGAGDYAAAEEYPSGLETGTAANCQPYLGNNSAPFDGGTKADYLFVDGHVQALAPVTTDPNPESKPSQNLWVCDRPDNDSQPVNWAQGPGQMYPSVSLVHAFGGVGDGAGGSSKLILGQDGSYYGVSPLGGANLGGAIFRITPTGEYQMFYSFPANSMPLGGLAERNGVFFGTTSTATAGSADVNGTVYKFTVKGSPPIISLQTLHVFDGTDGMSPVGLCLASDGNLYGTTQLGGPGGGGEVYQLTPTGGFTILQSFSSTVAGSDGYGPGELVQSPVDHLLYGVCHYGGENSCGTVFSTGFTAGAFTPVFQMTTSFGSAPDGLRITDAGEIYGTATGGGASGDGTIFRIPAHGTPSVLHSFTLSTGANPHDGLISAPDGYLYGITSGGGKYGDGTVYRIKPGGSSYSDVYAFVGSGVGETPAAALLLGTDGNLYGSTTSGTNLAGAIFTVDVGIPAIAGFSPMSGKAGANIIVVGNNLSAATAVTINGAAASFTIISNTEIAATIPTGAASSGTVTVTTPAATASEGTFTVI